MKITEVVKELFSFNVKNKKIDYTTITFVIILCYVSFFNLFVLRSTPEIMALEFAAIILIFRKVRLKEFGKFWIPFLGFFFLYEFLRGFADDVSPFYNYTLHAVFHLENALFQGLPSAKLQHLLGNAKGLLNVSVFFYSIFFYYSFFVAFLLWYKKSKYFVNYMVGFIALSFAGLLIFFLVPTAPPWMIQLTQDVGVSRYLHTQDTFLRKVVGVTVWQYFVLGNQVAALPSLHTAWPAFTTHFLVKHFSSKWLYALFIIPAMIAFSVVFTAEHYVIDIVLGWGMAYVCVRFSKRIKQFLSSKRFLPFRDKGDKD